MGVGMPADLWLNEFGSLVWSAFGKPPYHVGSSLANKDGWRDVDVRVMLDDEEWVRWGFSADQHTVDSHQDPKWVAICLAFSALGRQMTGLPIDFQVQRVDDANEKFPHPRSALGIIPLRRAPHCETCDGYYHHTAQHDDAVASLTAAMERAKVGT